MAFGMAERNHGVFPCGAGLAPVGIALTLPPHG